jgi:hypothetical protein
MIIRSTTHCKKNLSSKNLNPSLGLEIENFHNLPAIHRLQSTTGTIHRRSQQLKSARIIHRKKIKIPLDVFLILLDYC